MSFNVLRSARAILMVAILVAVTTQITHQTTYSHSVTNNQRISARFNFSPAPIILEEPTFQEKDIFILVNYYRKKNKASPLKWDRKLAKLTRFYSRKMAREDHFEHQDKDGKTVVERADDFKIKGWRKIGENLFYSRGLVSPSADAVDSWMDSPGHRLNMLDGDYTHTAIGVYEESPMVTYITQVLVEK